MHKCKIYTNSAFFEPMHVHTKPTWYTKKALENCLSSYTICKLVAGNNIQTKVFESIF